LLLFLYLIQHVFCPANDSACFVAIRYKPCAIYQIKLIILTCFCCCQICACKFIQKPCQASQPWKFLCMVTRFCVLPFLCSMGWHWLTSVAFCACTKQRKGVIRSGRFILGGVGGEDLVTWWFFGSLWLISRCKFRLILCS
jgi:hypothetical protein